MRLRSNVSERRSEKGYVYVLLGGHGTNLRKRGPAGSQAPPTGRGKAVARPCQAPHRWRTAGQAALLRCRDRPGMVGAQVRAGALGPGDRRPAHGPEREPRPGKRLDLDLCGYPVAALVSRATFLRGT